MGRNTEKQGVNKIFYRSS